MQPPEISTRTKRGEVLLALFMAALALSAIETVYAWAEHWYHTPQYFALAAGLTLALALTIGAAGELLRFSTGVALALFAGACLGLDAGWPTGVAGGVLALAALRLGPARRLQPAVLGTCAALALACAVLKDSAFAEHLGHEDELLFESLGATLLCAGALAVLPALLALVPARTPGALRVLVLLALGCGFALRPRIERGDGEHRRPPPDYARSEARVADAKKPSVFVLVLDTVRADHLPAYGYARETMPELGRMLATRANARVYPRAYANGTWTVPSHASLFTAQLPNVHGAHFALDGSVRVGFGLAPSLPTLAEQLQRGGYATLAGYANHWLRSVQGMGRGFDRYLRAPDLDELPFVGEALRQRFLPGLLWGAAKGCARARDVNATLLSMIEPWSAGPNPLFVFANYVDAHGPYAPPAPFRGRFAPSDVRERSEHLALSQSSERHAELMARYDEELLYLDSQLGELFRALDGLGLLRSSWLFITADHGEAFGEHGVLEHGTTVFDEVTRIPLIVFPPEGVVLPSTSAPVSLVDVAATAAAIGGVELPGAGRDLRALEASGLHPTVLEFYGDPVKAATLGELAKRPARAVVLGRHKLIAYSDALHLYDVEADPGEHVDLARALPHLVEHLKSFLPAFGEPTFRSDREAPLPEALDALRGLGYGGGLSE
ncbi:MAG: sulfatase [Planctomycetes bacterium]|nr:sulfatase [Planctomycetota bacterium]